MAVREYVHRRVPKTGWLLAFALVILTGALPVTADVLKAVQPVAQDRLFDPSSWVTALPSSGTDLDLPAAAGENGPAITLLPSEPDSLDLLAGRRDDRPESGAAGVRRFLFLAIVFGAALRYLTSPTFYAWASDVFDPLDGY